MITCPDTDALATIGGVLSWDLSEALQHLQTCADCRARIDALQVTRSALAETETVEDATLARISAAIGAAARGERARRHTVERWGRASEALLAGISAPIVLLSSGIELGSAAAVLTFGLGAAFLIFGRRLRLYAV